MKQAQGSAEKVYTTNEVSKLTGASLRQLQWWDEQEIIRPDLLGHERRWNERSLIEVRLLMGLRQQGVSLQQARSLLKQARSKRQAHRVIFATDGHKTFAGTNIEEAFTAIRKMKRARLAICDIPGYETHAS